MNVPEEVDPWSMEAEEPVPVAKPSWTMRNLSRRIQRCIRLRQFHEALQLSSQLLAMMREYPDNIRGEPYVLFPPYVQPHDL
jgi:hypothetical protein